jgi:hypothetical protein
MVSADTKQMLSYRQMVALSAMMHRWALEDEENAGWQKRLLLWSRELLTLALEVGPSWEAPTFPEGQAPTLITYLGMQAELAYETAD